MACMGVYHHEQWIILFCQMWFWFDHHSKDSCLPRRPPQKSAEPDITWFTKPVFSSSHYSYLRPKMTWSNLQMDGDQICRHILTPQCVKWFQRTQWTFNPDSPKIVLVGSLGESCDDFTQGWRSKHLQGKAKTNNFKNRHWRQYLICKDVCLFVWTKPVVCSQTRPLANSKQHLCWTHQVMESKTQSLTFSICLDLNH